MPGAALGIATPQINPVGYFNESQRAALQEQQAALEQKKQGLQGLYMMSAGILRGNLEGQADPQEWEQALDMLEQQGVDAKMVAGLRGKPHLANVMARGSAEALRYSLDERQLDFALKKFEAELQSASAGNPTDDQREYQMAKEQGFTGSFIEFKKALQANSGMAIRTNPDGTMELVQGDAVLPSKITEGQGKDMVYYTKGQGALEALEPVSDALTSFPEQVAGMDPTGIVRGNQTPEYQKAYQAGREFLAAVLRKDTGAAVTASEEQMYGDIYLPRPGDGPEVLTQKKEARRRALDAIAIGLPPGLILKMESAGVNVPESAGGGQATDAATSAAAPAPVPSGDETIRDWTEVF